MKNLLALLILLLASAATAIAQDSIVIPPPADPTWSITDYVDLYQQLEAAVIIILGYLHNYIPGLNMIRSKWFRIVLIGAVTAVIFFSLGLSDGFGVALGFFQAVGLYSITFSKLHPSEPVNLEKKTAA